MTAPGVHGSVAAAEATASSAEPGEPAETGAQTQTGNLAASAASAGSAVPVITFALGSVRGDGEVAPVAADSSGGAGFVVVANRLPVDGNESPDGELRWERSPGGLVTALEPVLHSHNGTWVGWAGIPDVDVQPFVQDGLTLLPVRLSADEVSDYYEGFSNRTLWPLYHDVVATPQYRRDWWHTYVRVNQRFAEATAGATA